MNYIKHLTGFFEKASNDFELNPTHISLYMAIFQHWNQNRFQNPISISRDELMRISKISSTATYHKCIKELTEKNYVNYMPSFNPFKGSTLEVMKLDFYTKPIPKKDIKILKSKNATPPNNNLLDDQVIDQVDEQALNKHQTSPKQALNKLPIIYKHNKTYTNISNIVNAQAQKNENDFNDFLKNNEEKIVLENHIPKPNNSPEEIAKKKLREKKGTEQIPPDWESVLEFFSEKQNTAIEAEKFYNYYQSNGWLVGGKSKMKDWKAGARNWMLNAQKFSSTNSSNSLSPKNLNVSNSKNYAEPL
ncbi:transcriptional regulator [Flavobacterium taihuense]|uniref:Transcriptional regulator n=1 Tax=Flavobacterium taihuense TaxID=2857508 RepID=A0ABS6XRS7_9FLAO|nr:transcriptional regulator [Flavobacterium taihuense]MBW4359375.1 transcriptional regulator [Flavobacterium taihuense]